MKRRTGVAPRKGSCILRAILRSLGHHGRDESGQTALLFLVIMFMSIVAGVLMIDVGMWYGDRRSAPADADFIALAAAQELPDIANNAAAKVAAELAAVDWAASNGVSTANLSVAVIDTCFADPPAVDAAFRGVRVAVRQPTSSFFLSVFGSSVTEVSATATACTGQAVEMVGFLPFAIQETSDCFMGEPGQRVPRLGELCDIVVGGGDGESGDVGQLAFDPNGGCSDGNGNANIYSNHIVNGVQVPCKIGDSVTSNTGVNLGPTKAGLRDRLVNEDVCSLLAVPVFGSEVLPNTLAFNAHPVGLTDLLPPSSGQSGGGVDDFFEVWRPGSNPLNPAADLQPIDSVPLTPELETSPRNVVLIVIGDIAIDDGSGCNGGGGASPHCYTVRSFGRLYIEGCRTSPTDFSAKCDQSGGGGLFTLVGRFVESVENSGLGLGIGGIGAFQTILVE